MLRRRRNPIPSGLKRSGSPDPLGLERSGNPDESRQKPKIEHPTTPVLPSASCILSSAAPLQMSSVLYKSPLPVQNKANFKYPRTIANSYNKSNYKNTPPQSPRKNKPNQTQSGPPYAHQGPRPDSPYAKYTRAPWGKYEPNLPAPGLRPIRPRVRSWHTDTPIFFFKLNVNFRTFSRL